jgi:uncharacterized membrane protein YbjE (DUF340 family)
LIPRRRIAIGALQRFDMSPEFSAVILSVLLGALVLNWFTPVSGVSGYLINAVVLFIGAELADLLTAHLTLPFDYVMQRTLFVTLMGMLVASAVMLILFSGPRE